MHQVFLPLKELHLTTKPDLYIRANDRILTPQINTVSLHPYPFLHVSHIVVDTVFL